MPGPGEVPAGGLPRPSPLDRLHRAVLWAGYRVVRLWWHARCPEHVGALVVLWHEGRAIIVRTSYLPVWSAPGGGVAPGETPRDAALRETREELGLDLEPASLNLALTIEHAWQGRRDRVHLFEVHLPAVPTLRLDRREVVEARLLDPATLASLPLLPHLADYFALVAARGAGSAPG